MRQKISVEIFNYWDRIRGFADAPLRTAIEPASVRHILPHLFILEMTPSGENRFRLAGTMVCSLFGKELRNDDFTSIWTASQPADIAGITTGVMTNTLPILLNATGHNSNGRTLPLEIVMMPVRSAEDRCDRLLGCIVAASNPPWILAEPLDAMVLERSRLMQEWSTAKSQAPLDAKLPKSVYVSTESGLRSTFRRALHLRIFDGGRAD